MTAPTEAEIRAMFARYKVEEEMRFDLEQALADAADSATDMIAVADEIAMDAENPNFIWDNLRPTEKERLDSLIEAIFHEASEAFLPQLVSLIVERTIQAALTFAAEFPDAPRVQEPVPA